MLSPIAFMFPTLAFLTVIFGRSKHFSDLYLITVLTVIIVLLGPGVYCRTWAYPDAYFQASSAPMIALWLAAGGILISFKQGRGVSLGATLVRFFPVVFAVLFTFHTQLSDVRTYILVALHLVSFCAVVILFAFEGTPHGYSLKTYKWESTLPQRELCTPPSNNVLDEQRNGILFGAKSVERVYLTEVGVTLILGVLAVITGVAAFDLMEYLASTPFYIGNRTAEALVFCACAVISPTCAVGALLLLAHSISLLAQLALQKLNTRQLQRLGGLLMAPHLGTYSFCTFLVLLVVVAGSVCKSKWGG